MTNLDAQPDDAQPEWVRIDGEPTCLDCGSLEWSGHLANCPSRQRGTVAPDELAQDGQPESYMSIALRVRELEARPCPHVVTGAEGTQYCSLAEESVKRLEAQLASARVELGNKNGALGLREYMIQALREQIDEAEKSNAAHAGKLTETIEMICERQSRLRAALERLEWSGRRTHDLSQCPVCLRLKRDGKHAPDCFIALALSPRGEGAEGGEE